MRRWAALAFVCLAGCRPPAPSPENTHAALQRDLLEGRYRQILSQSRPLLGSFPPDSLWHWKFRVVSAKAAHYVEPERLFELLAEEPPARPEFREVKIERDIWLGNGKIRTAQLPAGERLLSRALAAAESSGLEDLALDALIGLSGGLLKAERYDEAIAQLRAIARRARKRGNLRNLTIALNNEGLASIKVQRYAEAIPALEAAAGLTSGQRNAAHFVVLNNLGLCFARLGEPEKAIVIQKRAVAGQESLGYTQGLVEALGELGATYVQKGARQEALPVIERALDLARKHRSAEDAARLAGNLAALHIELQHWDRAATLNSEATEFKRKAGLDTLIYNTLNSAAIALGTGDRAAAARLYSEVLSHRGDETVRWQAHVGLARLAAARGDAESARSHYEAAIGLVDASRDGLTNPDLRLSYFNRLIDFYRRYVDFLLARGQAAEALAVAESSRAKVLAERTGYPAGRRPPPSSYQRLAGAAHAVILSYWLAPERSVIFVTAKDRIEALPLDADRIATLVDTYSRVVLSQSPLAAEDESGRELTKLLLGPVLDRIPAGSRVIITPDGPLNNLNFETLPIGGNQFFLERAEVTVAPSLALLAPGVPRPAARRRLLMMGDPLSPDPRYPRLENAAQEMAGVSAHFAKADTLAGENATPEAFLRARPESASHIHFTAHSIANRERPLDSAVVLSPGPGGRYMLYARDLMNLQLAAQLVTISACRSAGERAYAGEGLVGFSWAFLRAGAARVIAGLWDVDDQAAAELMGALYAGIKAGLSPAASLRAAKLAFVHKGGNFRKPYFWGPFQVYAAAL